MARYQLTEPHYLGNGEKSRYYEAGSIVDYDGPPSRGMRPVEEVAAARKADVDAERGVTARQPAQRAAVLHDPVGRVPGMPRVAGPPGQTAPVESNPANPVRTVEIAQAQIEHHERDAAVLDEALEPGDEPAKPSRQDVASPKPASGKAVKPAKRSKK